MKKHTRIAAALIAAMTAATCMVAITASASNTAYWSVLRQYQAGIYKYFDSGTVTGLTLSNDTGIKFTCTEYYFNTTSSSLYARCDIDHAVKQNVNTYVSLNGVDQTGKLYFNSEWYNYSHGSVHFDVYAQSYPETANFGVYGTAK